MAKKFDVVKGLKHLARQIKAGEFNDAHNLAWIIDCGDGQVELGLLGESLSPAAEAHFLFALAQRRLVGAAVE